ncbi:MAG: protein-export chaperone SecB [Rickettsiaceae bacterium]|nr:protein-export chaperone SecB [Rickettsiaceae bacterium]
MTTPNKEEVRPQISINAQYIKDLSFENPEAPFSLAGAKNPVVDLAALDVNITRMPEENVFEVALHIEAEAKSDDNKLFIVDLLYAGIFTLVGIPEEDHKVILGIHCPSMLFPFARKIIADVTQDGGFQALMIDPIDFGALFHKKMEEEGEAQGTIQ